MQFHQLALQAEQFLEIDPAVDGLRCAMAGKFIGQRVEGKIAERLPSFSNAHVSGVTARAAARRPERFRAKWIPVRVKKTRQKRI